MKRNKLVNWQEDMSITPKHFVQTENYFLEELSESRSVFISKNNFGLLPLKETNEQIGIQIREHISNHVEVTLYNCNAITASGEHISFNPGVNEPPLSKVYSAEQNDNRHNQNSQGWNVILSVDPYTRIVTGEIDPMEEPPRHPDSEPMYKLHIVASEQINLSTFGAHFLTIGKIRRQGDRYVVDANYIPPCRNMSSHPDLVGYFRRYENMFFSLRRASRNIISKVNDRSSGNELAVNIRSLSQEVLRYLMSIHFNLKNTGTDIAPVAMTESICTLAAHCYTSLLCLPGVQKDELLKYFFEWSDVTPGSFQELLSSTMELEYEHINIRSIMVRLETFLTTLTELWDRLSRLEYIGQHKESLVVSVSGGGNGTEERRGFMISD